MYIYKISIDADNIVEQYIFHIYIVGVHVINKHGQCKGVTIIPTTFPP